MYLATYKHANKTYNVAINGQTGATFCDAPSYLWKIILFIVLGFLSMPILMGLLSLLVNTLFGGMGG